MNKTKIPWVKNADGSGGYTWNPILGCTHASAGCDHCYAEASAHKMKSNPNRAIREAYEDLTFLRGGWTGKIKFMHERLEEPIKVRRASRIFVCSMSDLFHDGVETEWIEDVLRVAYQCNRHDFILLTKRPARMAAYFKDHPVYPNLWLGVTCENQARIEDRLPILMGIKAAVRFVSVEPMLTAVRIPSWFSPDWIVAGPENGAGARPCNSEWIYDLGMQCLDRGIPFFDKRAAFMARKMPGESWT